MNMRSFFFAAVLGVVAVNVMTPSKLAAAEVKAATAQAEPESKNSKAKVVSVYFKNCSEARAAGYSNMLEGKPGYAPHLDRDKDGIACETR